MISKYLLIVIFQGFVLLAYGQEFWNGTKNPTSTISRAGQTSIGALNFRSSGTGTTTVMEHIATTGDLYMRSVASTSNGDSGNIILNDVGGFVGIGTSSPRGSLHIAQANVLNAPIAPIILSRYWLNDENTRASAMFHYYNGANEELVFALSGGGGSLNSPVSLSQAKMVIQSNGKVGIGTVTPKEKLSVNGTVQAKEINVSTAATDWPDYVFDKDYRLLSLEDVSKQIKKEGHLPDMPSADELYQKGIQVGKLLSLQQKKIEELTLYVIEQQKEIKALKTEFEKLLN